MYNIMCNFRYLTVNDIEILVIILVIAFMQGIYNYIPETDYISSAHSVAAVLYLQFVLHVMLFNT
jgi:hypothetical protein